MALAVACALSMTAALGLQKSVTTGNRLEILQTPARSFRLIDDIEQAPCIAGVTVYRDGTAFVRSAATDIGTGTSRKFRLIDL
jgi:hypothetical protein